MDIKQAVRKPEFIEVKLDSEDIVQAYGEPVTFWMTDSIDIITYFDFYKSQSENDGERIAEILRKIIKNKDGESVLDVDSTLPVDLTVAALIKINEILGKSKTKPST